MATAPQIRAIYALGSKLGINQNSREDNLHQFVYSITGKESIKELTNYEASKVQSELMSRMKGIDRKVNQKPIDVPPGKMSEAQQKKAWSLIYKLQEIVPSAASPAERMRGAVKKIIDMDINPYCECPFRMVTVKQGIKLIDTLKKYVASAEKKAGINNEH